MAFEFPGLNPISAVAPSRKAIAFKNWLDDNLGISIVDLQQALYRLTNFALGASGDWYFRAAGNRPVIATVASSMQVTLKAGVGFLDGVPIQVSADITSLSFVAPVSESRIDVLCVDPSDRTHVYIEEGVQDTPPVAPAVTGDYIPVAEIYHRVGETTIEDADDATNGYITCLYVGGCKTFTDADVTPSVAGGRWFNTPTTVAAPYIITTLHDGIEGEEYTIVGRNADCSINDAGNMKIAGAWTATPYNTIKLLWGGANWFEISRSANA